MALPQPSALKKLLLAGTGAFLILTFGLFFWARAVLASDAVRLRLAEQISESLGQPVSVGSLAVTIFPRVGVSLQNVTIGQNAFITVHALEVAADVGALLSRRIEHATLRLNGARVVLPLPPLAIISSVSHGTPDAGKPAVEITSIDDVVLHGVDIVSGGRTLRGDIEMVPSGKGVDIRKISLSANGMTLTATGTITDVAGPVGTIAIHADTVDVDQLLAFANDFSGGVAATFQPFAPSPPPSAATGAVVPAVVTPAARAVPAVPMNLSVTIDADRATMSRLTVDHLSGRAVANDDAVSVSPLSFSLFGGRYEGALRVTLGEAIPTFHWTATISHIDVAAATAFGGHPNVIAGTLNGRVDLTGRGNNTAMALKSAQGTARIEVLNGVVRNLGLVRSVGNAASLSLEGLQRAAVGVADVDERFTRLGGTMTISEGIASTQDLRFEAGDVSMAATGTAYLDASELNLRGQLQLSEALSRHVHQTILRMAQDEGRIVLPTTITGPATNPVVKVDTADITRRALVNTAKSPRVFKRIFGK